MGILSWLILGIIAGFIAKLLMPGRDPGGIIVTMLLGIAGAFAGGFIGRALWGSTGVSGVNLPSIGLAVLGAFILLLLYRLIVGRKSSSDYVDRGGRRAA
ncbi:MAG: Transglycosylase-associated protein [Acidobacteriales bacterium]|nr:Transglycosylase-associated protein [Terriglobales bacterium]